MDSEINVSPQWTVEQFANMHVERGSVRKKLFRRYCIVAAVFSLPVGYLCSLLIEVGVRAKIPGEYTGSIFVNAAGAKSNLLLWLALAAAAILMAGRIRSAQRAVDSVFGEKYSLRRLAVVVQAVADARGRTLYVRRAQAMVWLEIRGEKVSERERYELLVALGEWAHKYCRDAEVRDGIGGIAIKEERAGFGSAP